MAKYITEVLKELNNNPGLFETEYKKQGDGGPLGKVFYYAFNPEGKFKLPDGAPPFKKSAEPIGMTPGNFINEIRRFYHLCRTDLSPLRREQLFVQILEAIHPDEALILIAIKDQKLTDMYPNITRKRVADAGFIPPSPEVEFNTAETSAIEEVKEVKKEVKKETKRGRKKSTPETGTEASISAE
jgi:hypothetical protein